MRSFDLDIENFSVFPRSPKPGPCPLRVPDYGEPWSRRSKLQHQVTDNCPDAHCPKVQWATLSKSHLRRTARIGCPRRFKPPSPLQPLYHGQCQPLAARRVASVRWCEGSRYLVARRWRRCTTLLFGRTYLLERAVDLCRAVACHRGDGGALPAVDVVMTRCRPLSVACPRRGAPSWPLWAWVLVVVGPRPLLPAANALLNIDRRSPRADIAGAGGK
jgi:hypothetical protein